MKSNYLLSFALLLSISSASAQDAPTPAPTPAPERVQATASAPSEPTQTGTPEATQAPPPQTGQENTMPAQEEQQRAPASTTPDAFVMLLKGEAVLVKVNKEDKDKKKTVEALVKDSPLKEGDIVRTKDKSFLRIKMKDDTLLSLGPNSELEIKKMKITPREISLFHIKGQIRAKINQKSKEGETWKLNSKIVSVGVRGTEFLSNAYLVGGNNVADVALVEGTVNSAVTIPGQATQNLAMQPGNYFNTSQVALKGTEAMQTLSPTALKELANTADSFIPNIQKPDGSFIKLNDVLLSNFGLLPAVGVAAGAAVGAVAGAVKAIIPDKEEKKVVPVKEEKQKSRVVVKGDEHKKLKDQPWDIRDAMLNREEKRTENECYYWFYKKIPGGGDLERFRRERDCHEFDY